MVEPGVRRPAQMLALARLISISGSMAASIAITFILWDRTKSPAWVAAGALATSLVAGLLTPYAGSLGDRFDRRALMVWSDITAAVFFILLGIAVAMTAHPGVLVVLATGAAVCETPFVPASRAAMPNLVPDELLGWANGLLGRVTGLSFAVGPLVGGALAALIGVAAVFVVNAVTFVASALLVWRIRGVFQRGDVHGRASGGVREGFAFVSREPILRAVIFSGFVAFAGVGFVIVANPARAERDRRRLVRPRRDLGRMGSGHDSRRLPRRPLPPARKRGPARRARLQPPDGRAARRGSAATRSCRWSPRSRLAESAAGSPTRPGRLSCSADRPTP